MSSMRHNFSLFTLSNPLLLSIPLHKYEHHKPHWRSEHPVLMPLAHLRSETKQAPTGDAGSLAQSESGIQQKLSFLFPSALNLYPFLKTCHPLLHSCNGASFNNPPLYLCLVFLPAASMLHM